MTTERDEGEVRHLFALARQAGERLFSSHRSGLLFPDSEGLVTVTRTTLSEIREQAFSEMDEEAYIDEYEFIFFPSRPGEGIDASNSEWVEEREEWRDSDGLVYTAHAEGEIRIVNMDA